MQEWPASREHRANSKKQNRGLGLKGMRVGLGESAGLIYGTPVKKVGPHCTNINSC